MDDDTIKVLAGQLREPEGELGRQIGESMNINNLEINLHAVDALEPADGSHILEIGMGNGYFVENVLELAESLTYYGCDYSETMIEEAVARNRQFVDEGKAVFHKADAADLPLADHSIDIVFTVNTVYFWDDPQAIFAELRRVMKPEGRLLIAIRPKDVMEEMPFCQYNFRLFTRKELEDFVTEYGFHHLETQVREEPPREIVGKVILRETVIVVATPSV